MIGPSKSWEEAMGARAMASLCNLPTPTDKLGMSIGHRCDARKNRTQKRGRAVPMDQGP
jgi:hypothetical protein